MSNRTPQTPPQKKRTDSLIKQAHDALVLLEAEDLDLDQRSRLSLLSAQYAIDRLNVDAWGQPMVKTIPA
jgi:hypothetical protein